MNDVVNFVSKDATGARIYECPMCGAELKVPGSLFYGQCSTCKMTLIDYKPEPYQLNFHKSTAIYRLNIGGLAN